MKAKTFWIHAVTPVHIGAGRGVGFIDLPIAREKLTQWPLAPGSAVKGVMRDYFLSSQEKLGARFNQAFGKAEQGPEDGNAGSLVFTDARIILLPVRSLYGTFAYVTSPLALQRLRRDLLEAGHQNVPKDLPKAGPLALTAKDSVLVKDQQLLLEDLDFKAQIDPQASAWADFLAEQIFDADWQVLFKQRFVVLGDQDFNFLAETATEVNARVRLAEDTKTVAPGALWYEESLPAETVFSGTVWCDRVYGDQGSSEQLLETFCQARLQYQIGGKASTGKGRVRFSFSQ